MVISKGVKDLVRLVKAWAVGQPKGKRWWLHMSVMPLDAEPDGMGSGRAKAEIAIELYPDLRHASFHSYRKETPIDDAWRTTFTALLARYENEHGVRFRLDRAFIRASPPSLKKAVRAWLANVRPQPKPAGAFESIAAERGASEAKIRAWLGALTGGKGYHVDAKRIAKLAADDAFIGAAHDWLAELREIPSCTSKASFKRAAGAMCALKLRGDVVAEKFLARAKRSKRDALAYEVAFDSV